MTEHENNADLWNSFQIINSYYAKRPTAKSSEMTALPAVQCMLGLLNQLEINSFSSFEKSCLQTAHAYWLKNAKELEVDMISQCNTLEAQIDYRAQQKNHHQICLTQVLSIDKDHFDDLPEFFENIHLAGLPIKTILKTIGHHFNHISELKHLD